MWFHNIWVCLDQLWLQVALFISKMPNQTGFQNSTCPVQSLSLFLALPSFEAALFGEFFSFFLATLIVPWIIIMSAAMFLKEGLQTPLMQGSIGVCLLEVTSYQTTSGPTFLQTNLCCSFILFLHST